MNSIPSLPSYDSERKREAQEVIDVPLKEEAEIVERADRRINVELADAPHHYRSMKEWFDFFEQNGFEVVESGEEKPKEVRHGFIVIRKKHTVPEK